MRRLFGALGVDYTQWKALTTTALKLDVRAGGGAIARGRGPKSNVGAIAGQAFFYGVLGLLMAVAVAFLGDRFAAALLVVSYVVLLVATTVLMDLNGVILSGTDHGILGFRPVSSRTYFAAKLTNVLVYTLALATLIGLPPAAAFLLKHGATVGAAALAAVYGSALCMTLAIVAGYAWLVRAVGARRLRGVLSWVQFGTSFLVYGGFVVVSDFVDRSVLASFSLPWSPWLLLYPGTWFASYIELAAGAGGGLHVAGAAASAALFVLLARGLRGRLTLEYAERLGALASASEADGASAAAPGPGRWFRRDEARAVAILLRGHFRNDLRFRMGVLAVLPLTVLYLIMGLRDGMQNPGGQPDLGLLSVAALIFPLILKTNLAHSEAYRASWVYFVTPADRTRLVRATCDVLVAFGLVPYLIFTGAILLVMVRDAAWIFAFLAVMGLITNLLLLLATLLDPELPFARPHGTQSTGAWRMMVLMMLGGIFAVFVPRLAGLVHESPLLVAAVLGLLAVANLLVSRLMRPRIERQTARLEFLG
ncbi:MAG TPA: hypothetical protein VF192_17205 [Longimicrobiales bacterium]